MSLGDTSSGFVPFSRLFFLHSDPELGRSLCADKNVKRDVKTFNEGRKKKISEPPFQQDEDETSTGSGQQKE